MEHIEQDNSDFFQAGHEYDDGNIYTAPEKVLVFRCLAADRLPDSGELVALGFITSKGQSWSGTGMGVIHWEQGWRDRGPWTTNTPED